MRAGRFGVLRRGGHGIKDKIASGDLASDRGLLRVLCPEEHHLGLPLAQAAQCVRTVAVQGGG